MSATHRRVISTPLSSRPRPRPLVRRLSPRLWKRQQVILSHDRALLLTDNNRQTIYPSHKHPPAPSHAVCCRRPAGPLPSVDSAARHCQSPPGSRTCCRSGPVAVAVESTLSTRALSAPTPTPPHRPSPCYQESLSPGQPLKIAHHVQGYAKRPECDQGLLQRPGQGPRRYVAMQCANPTSRVGAAQRWRGIIWADELGNPATSNDPWGPTGTQMSEIAQLTFTS